jgi:hypothetical protein
MNPRTPLIIDGTYPMATVNACESQNDITGVSLPLDIAVVLSIDRRLRLSLGKLWKRVKAKARWNLACLIALPALLGASFADLQADEPLPSDRRIGYTEFRTNLPGGRHANVRTMRAVTVKADGTGRQLVAQDLVDDPDAWTQFAGWSPDGEQAIVYRGWQDPENAQWE